jgi:hypothetical protein
MDTLTTPQSIPPDPDLLDDEDADLDDGDVVDPGFTEGESGIGDDLARPETLPGSLDVINDDDVDQADVDEDDDAVLDRPL